jgi:hypothetical protein
MNCTHQVYLLQDLENAGKMDMIGQMMNGFPPGMVLVASTLHAVLAYLALETSRIKRKDFLMAFNELKLYLSEHVQAGHWGIDENTFHQP